MGQIVEGDWIASQPLVDLDGADLRRHIEKYSGICNFDLARKIEEWRTNGIVVFEGVVDKGLIDALLQDIEYLRKHYMDFDLLAEFKGIQRHLRDFTPEELESDGVKFNSIQTISHAAARLSLTPELMQFLRVVFDGAPCATQSLTFYRGSQQPIHIDYPYVRAQSKLAHLAATWIPLEDISPDAGPLAYYPGSHKVDVSGFFDWGDGSIVLEPDSSRDPTQFADYLYQRMREKGVEPVVYCPRKGDALIWHGNLAHEGTKIRDNRLTRMSYVTHYTSLDAYPLSFLKPGAPGKGGVINAENGGYVFEHGWQDQLRQLPSIALKRP